MWKNRQEKQSVIFIVLDGKQLKNGFKKDMWKNIFQKNSFILTATINNERTKNNG